MGIRTQRRYGFRVYGDIQVQGSWGACLRAASQYPDKDWTIEDLGPNYEWEEGRESLVTSHTAILEGVTGLD